MRGQRMRIRFNEISPLGSQFEILEIPDLAEQHDFEVNGPVRADCTLIRKGDDKVVLQGRVEVAILLQCDRCLGLYPFEVHTAFQLLFALEAEDSWGVGDITSSPVDLETEILDEPVIDLDDVLRQQVYLALPVKMLCGDGCQGLCLQCGVNLNETTCECAQTNSASPFAALVQLKK
jgi:uncharacterized protein